jgi:hypothetical protein
MATIELLKNLGIKKNSSTPFSSKMVGQLFFEKVTNNLVVSVKCSNAFQSEEVVVADVVNDSFAIPFDLFGIIVQGSVNFKDVQDTVVDPYAHPKFDTVDKRIGVIADNICNLSDVFIRAALPVDVTIPFGVSTLPAKSDANLSYGDYQGWVLYRVPVQSELDADTAAPNNMWQPYFGEWADIARITSALIPQIKSDRAAPLTLSSGSTANKFNYTWSEYEAINDVINEKKYSGTPESVQFTLANESAAVPGRVSVYLNGIYQDLSKVNITRNVISCNGINPNLGDTVTVIYKAYAPSAMDLSFDPDSNPTSDNPVQTVQYKYDYQYTVKEIRNASGQLVNTLYYFWVANKNIPTRGRSMSLQSAKNLLKVNTNPYAILQNISAPIGTATPSYNQFIGMGLNRYITEDNTYKIRFTRDFILRDDPKNIELKNVHTEWAMIREQQNTLIPEKLWNHLVDAACGQNLIGEPIPSLARVAYDERNGTSARYGFNEGQSFVDQTLALNSIKHAILNTSLTSISPANPGVEVADPIEFIDMNDVDSLFATPAKTRKTMSDIWTKAKPKQANEIFFTVLYDALAENYEFTDIFKTSMIAAHSIRLFSNLDEGNEN